jgi:PAS domain S-box-containing protein
MFEIFIAILTYFIVQNYEGELEKLLLTFILIVFILVNLYIGFYLDKRDEILLEFQKKLASENHINNTIFNLQKAIIVVRDDLSMTQANDTFFQTFNFKNIKDFTSQHICICELFIAKKNKAHIMPIMDGISWAHYIIDNPKMQHEVYMIDKYGNERIYSIDLRENIVGSKSMVVFTEITEIKNQMETFHKLFDNSVDGLLILQNNRFLDVNHALLKMLGCSSKENFLKFTPESLLPLHQYDNRLSSELHQEMIDECFTLGTSSRQRLQKKLSGEEFWCEVAMTKIRIASEDAIYVRWRDIHEYKLLQFSLESQVEQQAQALITGSRLAAIGEMMENITHQWKQPLSVILNLVNILKIDAPKSKELIMISEQTKYLNNTIADFKNFSSSSKSEKTIFKLNKSIERTLKMFQFQIETHNRDKYRDRYSREYLN